MNNVALRIDHLTFRYPRQSHDCIHDLSLEIKKGERFGLFGPNGAGKTTLMSFMVGLLQAHAEKVWVNGQDMSVRQKQVSAVIGYVPQDFAFYPELNPVENLEFFGAWSGLTRKVIQQRTEELLSILGLSDVANKQVFKFSGGMKRRINLAIGVIHQPEILFLDEPTVGVDVQTRHAIISYLKELNDKGTTLVYTSHHLKEAEDLCDRVALIDKGEIVAYDYLSKLLMLHEEGGLEQLFLKLTGNAYRD